MYLLQRNMPLRIAWSVYYFDLAWISLMNRTDQKEIVDRLNQIENARRGVTVSYKNEKRLSYTELHLVAALIRAYLYAELTDRHIWAEDCDTAQDRMSQRRSKKDFEKMLQRPQLNLWNGELQILLESLRENGNATCKDYAMNASGVWYNRDEQNAVTLMILKQKRGFFRNGKKSGRKSVTAMNINILSDCLSMIMR